MYLLLTPRNLELCYFDNDFYFVHFNSSQEPGLLKLGVGISGSLEIMKAKHTQNFIHNFWEAHPGKEVLTPPTLYLRIGNPRRPTYKTWATLHLSEDFLELRICICKNLDSPKEPGTKNYPNMKSRGENGRKKCEETLAERGGVGGGVGRQ